MLEKDGTPTLEELKEYFHTHDEKGQSYVPDALNEIESITDEELEDLYLQMLDSTQREIYSYRKNNMTQKEIAQALGYKTPGAVSKQMKKMLEKFYEMKSKIE